jgi:3-hydroxyisobutyrate dehydrogenase-like beta-hydroxyacid dehydrogenase
MDDRTMGTDVSVIGLGPMGVALGRALLAAGHRVTVWNRTGAKADALVAEGAIRAPSAAAAVAASDVVITCVASYDVSRVVLGAADVAPLLAGRMLIELTTGTPEDARAAEAWARARGADYVDGALMATPMQMGKPDTPIFVSGAESAFARARPVLDALGGGVTYLGASVGAASAWDLATLSCLFGAMLGFFHGARICETENLSVAALGTMIRDIAPVLGEMIRHAGEVVATGRYDDPQSSVRTCAVTMELFVKQARESGIDPTFPAFSAGVFRRAMAAGHAERELGAVIEVLRSGA